MDDTIWRRLTLYFGENRLYMEPIELIKRLNKMYRLYTRATAIAKPYRLHKIRRAYNELFAQASHQHEIILLDSLANFVKLFGAHPSLVKLMERKEDGIQKSDYENAAALREQEKNLMTLIIQQSGLNKEDHFFLHDGFIFFKRW